MSTCRVHRFPLCAAHEIRRDFGDVISTARRIGGAEDSAALWASIPEGPLDRLWAANAPRDVAGVVARFATFAAAAGVVFVSKLALREVLSELPASDSLAVNLRRLADDHVLAADDHAFVAFDDERWPCAGWIGEWDETAALLARLRRLSDETVPLLIAGETGTGKELVARAVHALGRRRRRRYLAINCAELPEGILEGELFGHVRGAFTGAINDRPGLLEAAGDGTVFLDEIGELPLPAQAKLLRVLEEHRVRRLGTAVARPLLCRIVAATNRNLTAEVARGRFRKDLYYRLRGTEIALPPLRERRRDVGPLAEVFAARAALRFRRPPVSFSEGAHLALLAHPWPGNVRELRQTVEMAVLATAGTVIDPEDLDVMPPELSPPGEPLPTARAVERAHILRALASTSGNKLAAARILGLSRQSLQRRIVRHGIGSAPENECPQPDTVSGNGASRVSPLKPLS